MSVRLGGSSRPQIMQIMQIMQILPILQIMARTGIFALPGVSLGCGVPSERPGETLGGIDPGPGTATGQLHDTDAGEDTEVQASSDTLPDPGVKLDVGFDEGPGDSTGDTESCTKADFLFVIDNSISMEDQQAALIASFPGFMAAVEETLPRPIDYHVMIVDTDAHTRCTPERCANPSDTVRQVCLDDSGQGHACTATFDACDVTVGAGVTHPAGEAASNEVCTFASNRRYIDSAEPDLQAAFECAARVGIAGWPTETPINSMIAALDPALAVPGACNEGFLRDDAVLVVTFISDDDQYADTGTPAEWYEAIVAAKGGNLEAIVMLGLIPAFEGCGPAESPDKGAHWAEFIGLFGERGSAASVCAPDYSPFFVSAVSVIAEACESFVPG